MDDFRLNQATIKELNKSIVPIYEENVRHLDIHHPILVIESKLWILDETKSLKEIKALRFAENDTRGNVNNWFDVVHSSYFETYAEKLTTYYTNNLQKIAKRQT
jgi:hypothetical protein